RGDRRAPAARTLRRCSLDGRSSDHPCHPKTVLPARVRGGRIKEIRGGGGSGQDFGAESGTGEATFDCVSDGLARPTSVLAHRARSECARWTRAVSLSPDRLQELSPAPTRWRGRGKGRCI